ncbi:MAG: glycosyltransferase [Nanoarchaeota archaeon]
MKKLVWVSSYLPRACGIAFYSSNYVNSLKKYFKESNRNIEIKIIAHTDADQADYPIIDLKNKNWDIKVLQAIKKEKPDVVHIQHEYGLYETYDDRNKKLLDLIQKIKNENIKVVITFHSVFKKLNSEQARFTGKVLNIIDAGIVHEDYQKSSLKDNINYNPKNVFVLPHGSREDIKFEKHAIREEFGYSSQKLFVGAVGLADERKGFDLLVKQWPKIVEKIPNAVLIFELKPHHEKSTRECLKKLLDLIIYSPVFENIEFIVRDYSEPELYKRLVSLDILALPYKEESQSGILAHGFSVGVPAIVTDIEGLGAEIKNSNAGIAVKKRSDFEKEIIKLLSSEKLRKEFSKNALDYVKNKNGWNIIAEKTFKIYEDALS